MAELAVLGSPGPFKAKKKDPEKMLTDFNLYVKAMKHLFVITDNNEATNAKKKSLMQSVGGPDMIWMFDYMGKVTDEDTYEAAIDKVRTSITGQTNQAVMMFKLFTRMGQGEQSFASWWSEVKEQADKCDFTGYSREKAARDAILYQTSNEKLRKRILAEDSNLETVIKLGLAYEQSASKASAMTTGRETEVSRIRRLEGEVARLQSQSGKTKSALKETDTQSSKCQTCGPGSRPHPGKPCRGLEVECYACRKTGHFKGALVCKGKPAKKPGKGKVRKVESESELEETESESSDTDGVGRVTERVAAAKEKPGEVEEMVQVAIRPRRGGKFEGVSWLPDSGVKRTLLAEEDWEKLKQQNSDTKLRKNNVVFSPYGTNLKLPVKGRVKVVLQNERGLQVRTIVYVVKGQTESLLGKRDGEALGIVRIDNKGARPQERLNHITQVKKELKVGAGVVSGGETQIQIDVKMVGMVEEYKDLFQGIGKVKLAPIHIFTKEGRTPVAQKQRQVAHHYMEPLRQHLQELQEGDVIEGPLGPEHATGWVSNVVITAKKYEVEDSQEHSKIRVNLDMRLMADTVKAVHLPIPTSEQLRQKFEGSDRFSVTDLNHAFHQFELDKESRQLFVFTTPFGLYRYKRLVMGTPPASAECHTRLKEVLSRLSGVVQIKDDLVVFGKGKEHDSRLRAVLERFRQYGITLRREKCKLGQPEVLWFGNVFSRQGMSPDPTKVEAVKKWPVPEDKAAVKSFLQTVQFCSSYMRPGDGETYSDLTKPLRHLTKQGKWYKWTEECQSSFSRLKGLLCSDTVLGCYDPERFTRVYVDHGPEGVASTVAQRYDVPGKEPEYRPVAYTSRSLKAPEKNYSKVEGESLAVLSGVMMNKQYLYGTKFEVVVDHKPLLPLYNSPNRPAPVRVDRHKAKLLAFRFKVVYEPGYTTPSDYGSRHPEPDRKHSKQEREDLGIEDEEEDKEFSINRIIEDNLPDAVTLPILRQAVGEDVVLTQVMQDVQAGRMGPDTESSGVQQGVRGADCGGGRAAAR